MLTMVEAGRQLWNDALAHRKRRWEEERLSTSYGQQCWIVTAERRVNPSFRELYAQAGQDILRRLDRAFAAFFEHRARYPRFKKFSQAGSFNLSPGIQRVIEARCAPEEALPIEGRECQGSVPQKDANSNSREAENLHRDQGTER